MLHYLLQAAEAALLLPEARRLPTDQELGQLEAAIGYNFTNPWLLRQALVHPSYGEFNNARSGYTLKAPAQLCLAGPPRPPRGWATGAPLTSPVQRSAASLCTCDSGVSMCRMSWLGDAVMGAIVSDLLVQTRPFASTEVRAWQRADFCACFACLCSCSALLPGSSSAAVHRSLAASPVG